MDVRGLGQGLGVFHVEMRVHYRTKDGYEGTHTFPTTYTVGGNESDAIMNAVTIFRPESFEGMTGWICSAINADPHLPGTMLTRRYTKPESE